MWGIGELNKSIVLNKNRTYTIIAFSFDSGTCCLQENDFMWRSREGRYMRDAGLESPLKVDREELEDNSCLFCDDSEERNAKYKRGDRIVMCFDMYLSLGDSLNFRQIIFPNNREYVIEEVSGTRAYRLRSKQQPPGTGIWVSQPILEDKSLRVETDGKNVYKEGDTIILNRMVIALDMCKEDTTILDKGSEFIIKATTPAYCLDCRDGDVWVDRYELEANSSLKTMKKNEEFLRNYLKSSIS
jgi:hypothetical protein